MKRQNQILAIVLALQIILAGVLFWPKPAPAGAGAALLPGLAADQVTRITIHDGTGSQVQLAHDASAGWVLPQIDNYPCLADKVTGLLDKLAALKTGPVVATTEVGQKSLKVADESYERLIELELRDGSRKQLYLGVSAGYSGAHVRVQGQTDVYLATGLSTADAPAQARGWVDTAYLNVPRDQVTAISVQNQHGTLEFEKDSSGAWTLRGLAAGETANTSAIQTLLGQVTSIYLTEPLGKTEQADYGLQSPAALVKVTTRDSDDATKTYTLSVGAAGPDGSYVVKSSETPYHARVASYSAQDLVNKTRQDYIQQPTPEPTVQETPAA